MSNRIALAVAGAHLSGQPLNFQLTGGGAVFLEETLTSSDYRLFALATTPPKPGLQRVATGAGQSIKVEVWSLTPAHFGEFVAALPQPMTIGKVGLSDGRLVSGFLCESIATEGATDITEYGGWLNYLNQQ